MSFRPRGCCVWLCSPALLQRGPPPCIMLSGREHPWALPTGAPAPGGNAASSSGRPAQAYARITGATAEPEQPVWKGQPEALQGQQRQAADAVHIEEAAVAEALATLIADTERLASVAAWTHLKLCSPGTALATVQVAAVAPNYSGSSSHTHHLCTACPPPLMQQICRGLGGQGS